MSIKNVFAWTAPGCNYPEYLNISEYDGSIVVSMRTKGEAINVWELEIPREELPKLRDALTEYLDAQDQG